MKLEGPGESDKIKKLPRVKAWKRVGVGACRLLENSTVCQIVDAIWLAIGGCSASFGVGWLMVVGLG